MRKINQYADLIRLIIRDEAVLVIILAINLKSVK